MNSRRPVLAAVIMVGCFTLTAVLLALWMSKDSFTADGAATANTILLTTAVWAMLCTALPPVIEPLASTITLRTFWMGLSGRLVISLAGLLLFAGSMFVMGRIDGRLFVLWMGLGSAFVLLLQGLAIFFYAISSMPLLSRIAATAFGWMLIVGVFFANEVLESAATSAQRADWISTLLYANPWIVASSYAFDDSAKTLVVLQQRHMYDLSVIGSYYGDEVVKPGWKECLSYFSFWGLSLHVAGALLLASRSKRLTASVPNPQHP